MLTEQTIRYKTFIKHTLVEGLRSTFAAHADPSLQRTKVTIEYPTTQEKFPAIIVRFFEREIKNAGVGHVEFIGDDTATAVKYKHYFYNGDIEFAVYALTSLDRDLLSDSLVQTLAFADLATYTDLFLTRVYNPNTQTVPESAYNFINLNTDKISGFGETQTPAPWQPEDVLVYQTAYRIPVFGEFYSLPPAVNGLQNITDVKIYPYMAGIEALPTGADDPSAWQ